MKKAFFAILNLRAGRRFPLFDILGLRMDTIRLLRVEYCGILRVGAMVARLALDQVIVVRVHDPQP